MQDFNLIVVSGLPGVGKSTLAEAIAKNLGIPIFSVDPIESAILESGIPRNFSSGLAAYLVAETLASEQLKLGMSAIIDAVSPVKEARETWRALSNRRGARLVIIECILDEEQHRQRIEARVRNLPGFPEVTWEQVETTRKGYLAWDEERLVLDTAGDAELNCAKALAYINQPR